VPEKDCFYSELVEKCTRVIVDVLGRNSIRALLMIGAPARSEVTVVETPDGLYSLSDIDLVCVCPDGSDMELLGRKLGPAVSALNRDLSPVCTGVDVALKSEAQLAAPAPLISTYELVRSPVVVWGDERTVSALGDVDIADVPNTESLTLMHNRMTEELLLRPPTRASEDRLLLSSLLSIYGTAKLILDSITSHLFIMNSVPTGFGDRVEFFLSDVVRRPESSHLREGLGDFLEELPAWATFKTTGDLGALAEMLGTTNEPADIERLSRDVWNRYIGFAEVFWRDILGDVTRTDAADISVEKMSRLYRKLESLPRSAVRTYRMLRPGRAPAGLFSGLGTYYRARLASPRALAYLTAVLTYLSFSDSVDWSRIVGTVRTCCPFDLPRGFASMGADEQRSVITERLRLFHNSVLLGRRER